MFVPIYAIVAAAALIFVLLLVCVVSLIAWFGASLELQKLEARVKVAQIDVYDLKQPLRRVEGKR